MRTAHSLLRLVSILLDLAQDALQFLVLGTRSSAALKAENIFLRKQLALYMPLDTGPRKRVPSQRWMTFVRNHAQAIVACDFFIVVTASFRVL
jgi:hypothetical protein